MNLFKTTNQTRGFTLIELLVVIGILGILAGTLFFAINPLEQLNRGGDAAKKSAIEGFVNGANGYYATSQMFPWDSSLTTTGCNGGTTINEVTLASGGTAHNCVTALITAQELRDSFAQDTDTLSDIYLTADDDSMAVCFEPESGSEQAAAEFNRNGTAYSGTGVRYWCIVQ